MVPSLGLREQIRAAGLSLGFVRVGFTGVRPFPRAERALRTCVDEGRHGNMEYLAGPILRTDPLSLLPTARSIVVVALPYSRVIDHHDVPGRTGFVARYARGVDYHEVVRRKLTSLAERIGELVGAAVATRVCVDTAPLCERDVAERAGIGFVGASTMLIVPGGGSYIVLGELLTDLELPEDRGVEPRCGRCRLCLDACPTEALTRHGMDARRCISYLTIEHRGAIPRELRAQIGLRVFGCDVCQEVCPFNASRHAPAGVPELVPRLALTAPSLVSLLTLGSSAYKRLVRGTALMRVSRNQLARNAAVALGNSGDVSSVPALIDALARHTNPLVRQHAAWALGCLGGDAARDALRCAVGNDSAMEVREECAFELRR